MITQRDVKVERIRSLRKTEANEGVVSLFTVNLRGIARRQDVPWPSSIRMTKYRDESVTVSMHCCEEPTIGQAANSSPAGSLILMCARNDEPV